MFLPRSMGGPELDPLTVFRAIEEISKADGSVGWCTMIATDVSLLMGWVPADIGHEFCRQPADFRGAGSLRPLGRAYPVDGGYRIQGRWNFASGIDHADWLHCPCIVTSRQRRAGRGNIGLTGSNISMGPDSSTAPPVMWAA
jgi:alkylation response protein AidB-like acyl-CoA dehydrogenase